MHKRPEICQVDRRYVLPKTTHLLFHVPKGKKLRLVLFIVPALILSGCASIEPQQFVGPNGKTAYSMRCSGMGRTLDACYKKSGEVCPSGYVVVDRASGTVAIPMSGGGFMAAPQHNLAIECK